jgi:hypothetical protein
MTSLIIYVEKLDQGHLHPKLEVPRLKPRPPPPREVNILARSYSVQCINSYSEHLHMSPQHGSPQCVVT